MNNHERNSSPNVREAARNATSAIKFEPLLDSEEAASLLKIHPKTLQKMARKGDITGVQIGKLWRFRASSLDEWLTRQIPR